MQLDQWTSPGTFYEQQEDDSVICFACAHQCHLKPGQRGRCQVRFNDNDILRVPWGYTAGLALDPIEKKPFNHFLPGAMTLSFGMVGCNFTCDFCQNWVSAQALNDHEINFSGYYLKEVSPSEIVSAAVQNHAQVIVSTYNEPWITAEWSESIFSLAHEKGLKTAFVSNGFANRKGLTRLRPNLDAIKIDLKCGTESNYHQLGGRFADVVDTIDYAQNIGLWVEVVTLVIPGWNDTPEELWHIARTVSGISSTIPWHVTAFHPDYKMRDRSPTSAQLLQTAAEIGQEAGLNYVYAGNLPGRVGSLEDTHCHHCQALVIQRKGFHISKYNLTSDGACPNCGSKIPGEWEQNKPHPHPVVF